MIKKRNVIPCIILSIITCYIYTLYWIVVINDEVLMLANVEGTSGKKVLFLTIITFGIYGIYWCCKMADIINNLCHDKQLMLVRKKVFI